MARLQNVLALAIATIASHSLGQGVRTLQYDATSGMFVDVADAVDPAVETTLFDCWTTPSFGGQSRWQGNILTGFDAVGEDMIATGNLGGVVTDIGYSLANLSSTRSIRFNRITFSFWSLEGMLIASHSRDEFFAVPIRPGELVQIFFGSNQFRQIGIVVPDQFVLTIQRESFDNVPASAFGVMWSSPVTAGTSSQFYRNFTTGQSIDLGSAQNNLTMYVKTDPIPSPSCASLLTASSLLALRRRRGFQRGRGRQSG